ncbi:hypothetical protein FSARC_6620 [Fusarium sarcochroum]|uniref:NACHT domain-containing protein n=1 Tax=Fusarium sarcochroum TaxID=1208366 RepID=A0A8H4X867_9HYPO|nr:hypothetical protein FSARC_6620 [Fusarium sarcochroum]
MEAAGIAFGAVALISLFKDCIDLFSLITAARDLGQEAAILETKLDVERMLLLQWSDRVGLLKHTNYDAPSKRENYDTPLKDPETRKTVLSVLKCIKSLLSQAEDLQQRYGLQQFDPSKLTEPGNPPTHDSPGASATRLSMFFRDFERLKIDTQQKKNGTRSSKISDTTKKIRWVITHRDKFNNLITNISHFNSSLVGLVPYVSDIASPSSRMDLSHVRSIAELDMIIQASADVHPAVRDAAIAVKKARLQPQILQRLWFHHHDERRVNVRDAHYKTLRWALDPPDDYMKWDDLNAWLQNDSSIYWISGKAGSGKSTLMKYLLGHSRTLELLNEQTCELNIISANFFFYALGRPEQKSQSGLLRSLLHQLLSHDPDSIETVLPNMWQEACTNTGGDPLKLSIPSVAEMKTALFSFCSSRNKREKLFFMIDGVDEYEGGDMDAAQFITDLGAFTNVKVLISSRPHPAFVSSFSHKPKMNLPDLTRDDIVSYIKDNVASHQYLVTLSEIQPNAAEELVGELATRVDELPREVEDLLKHMLDKIQPRWRPEAAKLLNLIFTNQGHDEFEPIPTLGPHFAYEQGLQVRADPSKATSDKIPSRQKTARCKIMEGLLRSRCCGLLEVQQAAPGRGVKPCICEPEFRKPHNSLQDSYVVFMHRTVYELLSLPSTWQSDFGNFQDMTLDSYAILSTMWCQLVPMASDKSIPINNALHHMFFGDMIGCPPENIIHCLLRLQFVCSEFELDHYWPTAKQYLIHSHRCPRCCDDVSIALPLAIEMGLTRVLGCCPNKKFQKPYHKASIITTVWTEWIEGDMDLFMELYVYGNSARKIVETTKLLLDANAEIQELEPETLSLLLERVDEFCTVSTDEEILSNQESWIEVQDIINSRLRYAPGTHRDSYQEKVKEELGPGSQKRAAEDDFTGSLTKRRKTIIGLIREE